METDKDHIHFLLSYNTTDRVCDIVKTVKQETTHYLWQKYNAVLSKRYWIFKEALDSVLTFCFDHVGSALNYKERFSVIDAFEKHSYVPKIYMHVNLCSMADNSTQLVPFLKQAEKMKDIKEYHDIEVFLHFEPTKGHNGIGMNEAIEFLYHILDME